MPRPKQLMTEADINAFAEGLKRLVHHAAKQDARIASLQADVDRLSSTKHGRRGSNGVSVPKSSNGARRAAWGSLLKGASAKKVIDAVRGARGGLSTIELSKKLRMPSLEVKRIARSLKRTGTFKTKGSKQFAKYQLVG